ncbi:MAG: 50S ribosomal protein L10 [Alphaproteobacteria bacterium]|nr:50S ribosomal protein L10 [Alphaproteobacteria bacterium]
MDRAAKKQLISELNEGFASAQTVVVAHYKGLTVAEITDLRRRVRGAGGSFKVTKNTLTKLALDGTPFAHMKDLFQGPTAIAFSQDAVAAAKAVNDFAKANDKLVLIGGGFGDKNLDVAGVQALASLPSLDELRAKLVGLIAAPATKLVTIIQAPAGQVARVIGAYARKEA